MTDDTFTWMFSEKGQVAIAGALGGLVRWVTLRDDWRSGLGAIVVGGIVSFYLGPIAIPTIEPILGKLAISPDAEKTFAGFIIGIGGVGAVGFILDIWRARRKMLHDMKEAGNGDP